MKKRLFSCWLALLCPVLSLFSQSTAIHPLTVGESVPSFTLSSILHYKVPSARLADFKDQLLILDLMSTKCYSCIVHLQHLDSLQKKYAGRVQIMPVTKESTATVRYFLEKSVYGKDFNFPFAAEDTVLQQLFPHQVISHVVWIYKGKVMAITRPDYILPKNIDAFLAGKPLRLPVKQDLGHYDPSSPLFVPNAETLLPPNQALLRYYSTLTPYLNGFSYTKSTYRDTGLQTSHTTFINAPIASLYQYALGKDERFPAAYTRIEVGDSSRFFFNGIGYWSEWQAKAFCCYQLAAPLHSPDAACRKKMLADLDFHLGLYGRMEKRHTRCIIIRPDTSIHQLPPKPTGRIVEIFGLAVLQKSKDGTMPLFVEMGPDDQRYVPMPSDFNDIPAMRALLQPYGIQVVEEERDIEFLVISDAHALDSPITVHQ